MNKRVSMSIDQDVLNDMDDYIKNLPYPVKKSNFVQQAITEKLGKEKPNIKKR